MSLSRISKLLLFVLALAVWAATASAQNIQTDTPTFTFSYTNGAVTATQSANITDSGTNAYSNGVIYNGASGSNQWLTVAETNGTTPDTLVVGISSVVAAGMAPGSSYSATITITDS